MPNERNTENKVRRHFQNDPLFQSVKLEEQKSTNIRITECLARASKSGHGIGRPEFIITFPSQSMDYLIIVECKARVDKHESKSQSYPKDYAVDGVLHYAKCLACEFNVVAIAASGERNEFTVSNFLHRKGEKTAVEFSDKKLLSIYDYVNAFKNDQLNYNLKDVNIVEKAVWLNDEFQKCSISESMRNTVISGILLALQDTMFVQSYGVAADSKALADTLLAAIGRVLKNSKVRKREDMMGVYAKILDEPLVKDGTIKKSKKDTSSIEFFKAIIRMLHLEVFPLTQYEESGYDVLGRFYTEFVRYAASKQKQGLVLTPSHVTELFCELADLQADDVIYDPCCGTGGFLIAAMQKMIKCAGRDEKRKEHIRSHQLLGAEIRAEMFTFACANMMLRGDGKSNLDRADCFAPETAEWIRGLKPTVSFLNPPYDQGTDVQLEFVEKALEAVASQNGTVAAIVQMSCAIKDDASTNAVRKRLLDRHTLRAVISMPDDLFYPVGVVTCIMVFEANRPNAGKKTWFGYLKNDGFVKRKNKGRIDHFSRWQTIRERFLEAYRNSEEVLGISVKREVAPCDEWCAEAYMDTDYSGISSTDFEAVLKKYAVFKVTGPEFTNAENTDDEENQ